MKFQSAIRGIRKLFLAEVLAIAAIIAEIASFLYLAVNQYDVSMSGSLLYDNLQASGLFIPFMIFSIGSIILLLVSYILTLVGLINGSHDDKNFRNALWIELALLALSVVTSFIRTSDSTLTRWLNVLSSVAQLAVTLLVISGIARIAGDLGKQDVAGLCDKTRKWIVCTFLLTILAELVLVLFFLQNTIAILVFVVIIFLLDLLTYILYLRLLSKARNMA